MKAIHYSTTPAAFAPYVDVRCAGPVNPVAPKFKTNEWHRVTCKRCLATRETVTPVTAPAEPAK